VAPILAPLIVVIDAFNTAARVIRNHVVICTPFFVFAGDRWGVGPVCWYVESVITDGDPPSLVRVDRVGDSDA
jgi:hypothetical protein